MCDTGHVPFPGWATGCTGAFTSSKLNRLCTYVLCLYTCCQWAEVGLDLVVILAPAPVLSASTPVEALPDSSLDTPTSHCLAILVSASPERLSVSQ